jgi:gluconolactonase
VLEVLADNFQGKKFNAPNDICIDGKGRIWFSDPKYLGDEPRELDHRSVYRIDPDGSLHLAVTQPAIDKPNGVGVSPDGKTLYIADTNNEPVTEPDGSQRKGNMQLVAFDLAPDGSVHNKRILVDYAPGGGIDGMTFDLDGNIYAAVRNSEKKGIRVYSPAGKEIAFLPTPDTPTNCTFGIGTEADRLYVTTDTGFGRIRLNRKGYHPFDWAK